MMVIFSHRRRIDDWLLRMNTNVSIKNYPRSPMMILTLVCLVRVNLVRKEFISLVDQSPSIIVLVADNTSTTAKLSIISKLLPMSVAVNLSSPGSTVMIFTRSSTKSHKFVSLISRKPLWATFRCQPSRTMRNSCNAPLSCVLNSYVTSFLGNNR